MHIFKTIRNLTEQLGLYSMFGNFIKDLIEKKWQLPIGLDQEMNKLKRKRDVLNDRKEDTISIIKTEMRPCKKVKKEVRMWLRKVESVNADINRLVVSSESQVGFSGFVSRGFLQNGVTEKTAEVEEFLQQGKDFNGLVMDDPMWIGQDSLITTLFGELPEKLIRDIWIYLMDDRVSKIGVWRRGVVRKTTIMKLIYDRPVNGNKVIWVMVRRELNITKLQNNIQQEMNVSVFGLDDNEGNEKTRARKLCELYIEEGNLELENYNLELENYNLELEYYNLELEYYNLKLENYNLKLALYNFKLEMNDICEFSLEEVGIPPTKPVVTREFSLEEVRIPPAKPVVTTRSFDVCRYLACGVVSLPDLHQVDLWSRFSEI